MFFRDGLFFKRERDLLALVEESKHQAAKRDTRIDLVQLIEHQGFLSADNYARRCR